MIVYYHGNKFNKPGSIFPRYTICVDLPDKDVLEYMTHLGTEKTIMIPIGYTQLHPKDQYVKSVGRTLALSRTKSILFTLESVQFKDDNAFLSLDSENGFGIFLKIKRNSNRVYINHAFKGEDNADE